MKGFVLVTTLWILAMITIATTALALWTEQTLSLAREMQQKVQSEIDMQSTESTILYLLATQTFTVAGMTVTDYVYDPNGDLDSLPFLPVGQEIPLDDRPYYGHKSARFALQDERGLLSLNIVALSSELNTLLIRRAVRLLGLLGVKAELREPLISKLRDYADTDNDYRLNGAEEQHYQQRGLLLPANRALLKPMECLRVFGWAEEKSLWKDGLWGQLTTTALAGGTNINTAPLLILKSIEGINATAAERIIESREEIAFFDTQTLSQSAGVYFSDDLFELGLNFYPSNFIRITLWHEKAEKMRQVHIQLTPLFDKGAPWIVDYAIELPLFDNYSKMTLNYAQTPLFQPTISTETE